jgi:putative membrane protein
MQFNFILSLIASILVVIFAITNAAAVPVKIFFVEYELSLALIIFVSTALGAVIATTIGIVKQFKLSKQIKKLTNENQTLAAEKERLQEQLSSITQPQISSPSSNEVEQIEKAEEQL